MGVRRRLGGGFFWGRCSHLGGGFKAPPWGWDPTKSRGSCGGVRAGLRPAPTKEHTMIDLYYSATPNGLKMTLFLEEAGLPYRVMPVRLGKGEQFKPAFLAISPNNKIPALVDHDPPGGGPPGSLFESGALLGSPAGKSRR